MAKPSSIRNRWKERERKIAKILGGKRNPLSGGSNVTDHGQKRVGDVVGVEDWLVEVKDTSSKDAMYSFYRKAKWSGFCPFTMIHCSREIEIPEDVEAEFPRPVHERMVVMEFQQFLDMWKALPVSPSFWLVAVGHFYYTKRFPFGAWWDKLEQDWTSGRTSGAVKDTQLPLLIVHPKGKKEQLAVFRLNDLLEKLVET